MKTQNKKKIGGGGWVGGWVGGSGWVGQVGCERRSEVFVKMQNCGVGGGGTRSGRGWGVEGWGLVEGDGVGL